ncbi:MAG: Xaa-Pro peptidase family protein [Proteobacteria bacterium]|nr:Xaa-Pro peptidase family protein [Pseudomonadota bacterium]
MIQSHLRDQIDWEQPFTSQEYADRRRRVREAMAAAELDAIYVTNPADLTWLTGYDMIWYHLKNLTGLLLRADRDETTFFDSPSHTTIVSTTPEITDWHVTTYDREHLPQVVEGIAARGLGKGRIGIQPWNFAPHALVYAELESALKAGGARVSDASYLVEELRFVKSPAEIAVVRRAAEIADDAMAAARDAIAEGVIETQLEGVIMASMMAAGGGYPGIRSMIGSGPRAGTHHSPPQHRRIRRGDLVFVDFCGCLHRYHVNVNRTFSLGEPDPRWTAMMDKSAGCTPAVVEGVKVGDPLSKVQEVADAYIDAAGLRKHVWFVGGYSLGIAMPPDWCGSHWVKPRPELGERYLTPGQVFNLENQFDVWDNWPGGSGAAWIDSFLVTENGLEVLSKHPRNLVVV